MRSERGQATVELVAVVPALVLVCAIAWEVVLAGHTAWLAASAARAGARAVAVGRDGRAGARGAVPGWSRARMAVSVSGSVVRVALRPPSPFAVVGRRLEVHASAAIGSGS